MPLRLAVEVFRGPVGRAPSLRLAVWLSWGGPDAPWALTVLERRDDGALVARDGAVPGQEVDALLSLLAAAGLGSRPVRVEEVVDTSDTAGLVRVRADAAEVEIPMLSSGFEGEDADALRDFLRRLFDAAGVDSKDTRWAALGET